MLTNPRHEAAARALASCKSTIEAALAAGLDPTDVMEGLNSSKDQVNRRQVQQAVSHGCSRRGRRGNC